MAWAVSLMNDDITRGRRAGETTQTLVTCCTEQHHEDLMADSETEHYSWQQHPSGSEGALLGVLAINLMTSNMLIM